ncbi:MAG: PKD domain-containing protein [Bacteroidia bacterium]|nr:PKD domain-containing protein [Bacteroidia bacterium]
MKKLHNFKTSLLIACLLFVSQAFAQVQLSLSASTDLASVNTGNQFIYTLNYQISSLTSNGSNVVANMALPANLTPFDVNNFGNSVAYDESQVQSVTYNSGSNAITVTFVNPIPAGSTGQLQIKFRYTNGTTPHGYSPDLFASIDASNNLNADGGTGPVYSDTLNIVALASNKYTVSKVRNAGGAIDDVTIYKISIGNTSGSNGALRMSNAFIVDTLPVGMEFVEATAFSGTSTPVYNPSDRTVTWTFTSTNLSTTYSSSAYLSVRHVSPYFAIGSSSCNTAHLVGNVPVLPIGTTAPSSSNGQTCFAIQTPTPGAACSGGSITAATASWLSKHILAETACNTFKNGWYNSGNTELDSVRLTYLVDKSIDMNQIRIKPVYDGLNRVSQARIDVWYNTNLNTSVSAGTYYSLSIAALSGQTQNINITLPSGEYITSVQFKVSGNLPIGGSQDMSYCGDARSASEGAKDGSPIVEGTTYNTSSIGDDGTLVRNNSNGFYYYQGVSHSYSNCSGSAEILSPRPVFGYSSKTTSSASSLRASDTINYVYTVTLGGNRDAHSVIITDTLDSRLSYVAGSSQVFMNNSAMAVTPTVNGNVLVWNLGTISPINNYSIKFSAMIAPGTAPATINNKINLNSANGQFNGNTSNVGTTVISAVALRAFKGQSGCNPDYVYYPTNAIAQEAGPVNYKITVKNLGNVAAKDLVLVDVFPFIGDIRGSQWFANLVGPVTISDPGSTVYYTTTPNPCYADFTPAYNPAGCTNPSWTTTPPVDITSVKGIKITRSTVLAALDSIVLSWPMRAPLGTPTNKLMNNSIMYQVRRADNNSQLLPTTPIMVGMYTTCTPVLGSLGNYAWIDVNKNGIQDEAASFGVNGVKVKLFSPGPNNYIGGGDDILLDSTVTANDFFGNPGYYKFIELATGNYYVQFETTYNGMRLSPVRSILERTDLNNDADSTSGHSSLVFIDANGSGQFKNNTTIDAGYYPVGSLGNYVWWDVNHNGLQDEPASRGINGQQVILWKNTNAGYVPIDTLVTANDVNGNPGYYNFEITESGTYKVQFPMAIGTKTLTTATTTAGVNGNSDALTGTGFTNAITMNLLGSGLAKNNPTIDAGYFYSGTIGNYVWYDINENGVQDEPASAGLNGVKVVLWKDNGSGFVRFDSTTTSSLSGNPGYYKFTIYESGDFKVQFPTLVSTKIGTLQNGIAGTDGNSDFDTLTGFTPAFTMNLDIAGITKDNPSLDAGYVCNAPTPVISGNGLLCPGETGVFTGPLATSYQWYRNGVAIPGAINQSYSTNTPGVYQLIIADAGGCYSDSSNAIALSNNPKPTANFSVNDSNQCLGTNSFSFTNLSQNGQVAESIWPLSQNGDTPVTLDILAVELGMKFRSTIAGKITAIRFFKLAGATGPFTGKLYTSNGSLLATVNFGTINTSASGWQTATLSSPVHIDANTTYVVSYYSPNGTYAFTPWYFNGSGITNGNLSALQHGIDGGNGLFKYGIGGGFPDQTFQSSNYWVDVVFQAGLSYSWNFGSGTSTLESPTYTYGSSGSKSVTLVVSNQFGCSDTFSKTLSVRPGPIANFNIQALDCDGNFKFNNTSQYADYYEWGIYNQDSSWGKYLCSGNNPDYTAYLIPGTYTVRLIARSNGECTDTSFSSFTVHPKPVAVIGHDLNNCGLNAQFRSYSYYAENLSWNFGDPSSGGMNTSNASQVSHTFSSPGTYSVRLIAANLYGCSDTSFISVTLNPAAAIAPLASFNKTLVSNSCVTRVQLTNTSSNATQIFWLLPDGSVQTPNQISVALPLSGTYTIRLVAVSASGCRDTASQTVNVLTDSYGPVASFEPEQGEQCLAGNSFNFINNSAFYGNGWKNQYFWDFGDGQQNNTVTFAYNHQYASSGTYVVRLIARSPNGCSDTTYRTVRVKESAQSLIAVNNACGMTAQISNNSLNTIGNIWTFGEGDLSSSDAATFTHRYRNPGYYFIKHIALANNGCHDSSSTGVWATNAQVPVLNFGWDTIGCSGAIQFTNASEFGGWYTWNFGDGSAGSEEANPVHAYQTAGTYLVTLTAHNGPGCSYTLTLPVYAPHGIAGSLPDARISKEIEACTNKITFTNSSLNAGNARWIFDGTQLAWGPVVSFENQSSGFHSVRLIVDNGACFDTAYAEIQLMDAPEASFSYQSSSCSGTAMFINKSKNAVNHSWDFGDTGSQADTSTTANGIYTYPLNGTYQARLIVANNAGCRDTITQTVSINMTSNSALANFTWNSNACNCKCSNKIEFINLSSGNGNRYIWNFGDGNTSSQFSPNKGFSSEGNYLVTLTAITPSGCASSVTKSVYVAGTGHGPSAGFSTDRAIQCISSNNFNFFNQSNYMGSGWIKKHYWYFGDGSMDSSNSFIFNKKYAGPGTYTVMLVSVGAEGCRDTATMDIVVESLPCFNSALIDAGRDPFAGRNDMEDIRPAVTTGTQQQVAAVKAVQVYPNPSTGHFDVRIKEVQARKVRVRILNTLGQEVANESFGFSADGTYHVETSGLAEGQYQVMVDADGEFIHREALIILK